MAITAKSLVVAPISAADANAFIRRVHYSGKVVCNSQLHLGVFLDGRLEGAMQFGPSIDKRKIQGLVANTAWNGFIELNRLAFSERLPRNSESRAISVAMRLFRRNYPHIEWVISFADATQCGDGTIYRASGFVLTAVRANNALWIAPDGASVIHELSTRTGKRAITTAVLNNGGASMKAYKELGYRQLAGFQLRYLYFLNPAARERLCEPVLPFAVIDKMGARMYRGKRPDELTRPKRAMAGVQPEQRGFDSYPDAPIDSAG